MSFKSLPNRHKVEEKKKKNLYFNNNNNTFKILKEGNGQ